MEETCLTMVFPIFESKNLVLEHRFQETEMEEEVPVI